jgi:hypothetical protein
MRGAHDEAISPTGWALAESVEIAGWRREPRRHPTAHVVAVRDTSVTRTAQPGELLALE